MKSAFVIGAILFLTLVVPDREPRQDGGGAAAALPIESVTPEIGSLTRAEPSGRTRQLEAVDGYLWSTTDSFAGSRLDAASWAALDAGRRERGWSGGAEWEAEW